MSIEQKPPSTHDMQVEARRESQPEREAAIVERIFPMAEQISTQDIWDVSIEALEQLQKEISEVQMGPSRLSRGELSNAVHMLMVDLSSRRSMLDGSAAVSFAEFKKQVEDLRPFATGAF